MRNRDDHRNRYDDPPKKQRGGFAVTILAIAVFAFGLLGMIGLFGGTVRGFLQGAFGFMGYPFFAIAILATLFNRVIRKRVSLRGAIYGGVIAVIFLAWLQILTSYAEFDALGDSVLFATYVNACYDACLGTSGGVLVAWIVYPLLSWIGKYAAIPLAVLFFVVLFFALLPWMRAGEPSEKSAAPRRPSKRAEKGATRRDEGELALFVDKVRPGQRDARKLKFRGFFSKKSPEPTFFDLTDDRPLNAPEGMIPHSRAERYDTLRSPNETEPYTDEYDEYVPITPSLPGEEPRADTRRAREDNVDAFSDLPPFIRRYREDRSEQTDYRTAAPVISRTGDPATSSSGESVNTAPTFTQRTDASPAVDPSPKRAERRQNTNYDDIITDVADLERIRSLRPKEPTREPFLGEEPVMQRKPVSPAPAVAVQDPEPAPVVKPAPVVPETVSPAAAPVAPAVEPAAPVAHGEERTTPPAFPREPLTTITPRDASEMQPVETAPVTPVEPKITREQPAPVVPPQAVVEEEEAPIRIRKPRSDLGGTHRTSDNDPKPVGSYIPPNKVKQPDIEEVMREEQETPPRPYTAPPVTLLKEFPPIEDEENVEEMGETLIEALASFNIDSRVVDHKTGPTFTQFAVTLPDNMSVNKLTPLEKDIKRKLKVNKKDIRIIPSVPDLDAVGIEVPNKVCSTVGLRSIINSPVFEQKNKLMFAIGVDVSGTPVYGNLLKMPHLLVAGATGSGKSVCLNVIISSIIYHYSPEVVRFIMIDPKKVELSGYRNMPHMLIPSTITEPDKAINALSWLVDEMERRYDLLMNAGVKDIDSYNTKMEKQGGKRLYYIVFIIDEMADLMYVARKEIDEKVNRIAAKARAAGINMILATQRPSVDVITGTIKANLRARIAFKVGSYIDSKTIIDRAGAEGLFGNGDMLYMPADGGDLVRLQGPFISEEELDSIIEYVKTQNDCRFDYTAEKSIYAAKEVPPPDPAATDLADDDGEDELFAPALAFFLESGQASISKLQIKFRIGYGRAARIVQTMEERDYVSGAEGGNKTRSVKITREEFEALYGDHAGEGGDVQ